MVVTLDFTIPARLDQIPDVALMIEKYMQTGGFSSHEILDIQLAIEETLTNIIDHGYRGKAGQVTFCGSIDTDLLTLEISDTSPEFNPLHVSDPDISAPLGDRKEGGLGVYLIRQVTDSVTYRYDNGKNILTVTKKKK